MKKFLVSTLALSLILGNVAFAEEMITTTSASSTGEVEHSDKGGLIRDLKEKMSSKKSSADPICAGTAVEKRENALIAGLDTFNASMKTALTARATSLKDAWTKTTPNERNMARKTGRQVFETASKSARTTLKSVRKSAWDTFKTDIKACGGTGKEETAPNSMSEATML
ncbi:MAG: hypothetical protein WCO58_01195 [bacterium]